MERIERPCASSKAQPPVRGLWPKGRRPRALGVWDGGFGKKNYGTVSASSPFRRRDIPSKSVRGMLEYY